MGSMQNILKGSLKVFIGTTLVSMLSACGSDSSSEKIEIPESKVPPLVEKIEIPNEKFRLALSVSPFSEYVLSNVSISDGKYEATNVEELQKLFMIHGSNELYQRISTLKYSPQGEDADHGWGRGIERAKLAAKLGLPFNPEISLFDGYGDGGTQYDSPNFKDYPEIQVPEGDWRLLTLQQMLPPLRQYGAAIAKQILDTGVTVNYWNLGNEIDNGIAGVALEAPIPSSTHAEFIPAINVDPLIAQHKTLDWLELSEDERIAWEKKHLWPYIAQILSAVKEGILSVDPNAKFSTHTTAILNYQSPKVILAFYDTLAENGFIPDQFGTSLYPTSGYFGGYNAEYLENFKSIALALKSKYNRKIFIAEYGYNDIPVTAGAYTWNFPPVGYQLDEQGAANFTKTLIKWGIESDTLAGVRPWAPDYVVSTASKVPSETWQPFSLFHINGKQTSPKLLFNTYKDAVLETIK